MTPNLRKRSNSARSLDGAHFEIEGSRFVSLNLIEITHMRFSKQLLFAISSVAVLGCESPVSPRELVLLAAAEAKWAARGFSDYSVEVVHSCGECSAQASQLTRIEVVGGAVVRTVNLVTGEIIMGDGHQSSPVEGLFAWIRQANKTHGLKDLEVSFDDRLGYPTYVATFYGSEIQDGGGAVYLSHVLPLTL